MKKVLVGFVAIAALTMVGCGSAEGEATVGGKPNDAPAAAPTKAGVADATAAPAPAGVKTGTPGG